MFSGGDSSDGVNSLNQLGSYGFVNQVAVSNAVAAGQNIDWAQLAQQWIQMRDNAGTEAKTNSNINTNKIIGPSCNSPKFEEKGEADMDMDDEEPNEDRTTLKDDNNFTSRPSVSNTINQPWFFNEGNSSQKVSVHRPSTNNQWSPWSNRENLPRPHISQNNNINNRPINPTAHIPSLLKITVPHPNEIRVMPDIPNQLDNTNMMDAAKRKGLPAWIREGLEKMEREKQKLLEKEQQSKENKNLEEEVGISSINVSINSFNAASNGPEDNIDEGSTDDEGTVVNTEEDIILKDDRDNTYNSLVGKTYEQKLADLMIVVRRTLTELLLEATNEEIFKVADECIKSFKSKASSVQVIRKTALSTITGKLGLSAYGNGSSDESSDDNGHDSSKKANSQSESDNDSEEEIRKTIRLKRRAFIKTSEEIEEHAASAAAREEEKLKYFLRKEEEDEKEKNRKKQERDPSASDYIGHNIHKGYEKDFGEITETKIQHINGKRQRDRSNRKERTTRFSDNKDKYVTIPKATLIANISTVGNAVNCSTAASLSSNNQRPNIPDMNGLLPNYTNTGVTNVLNAADAALEKALKNKASTSSERHSRHHERDRNYVPSKKRQRRSNSINSRSSSSSTPLSSSSTSSSDSNSSTSRSSHHSKYNHRSVSKHKSHTSTNRLHEKSHKVRRGDRKYSSSSYSKRNHESKSTRYSHKESSDSDDEYNRRRKHDPHYSRNSHSRNHTSSRRDRERDYSRSLSRSSYSSSSNRRQ